jgi:phenylalanyl-tRNA synthetase beta chain
MHEEPMCIAGVFGGANRALRNQPKMYFWRALISIRFQYVKLQKFWLKNRCFFPFERGTDPDMTVFALKRAALLIKQVAGGEVSSEISDYYPSRWQPLLLRLAIKIDKLIGKKIGNEEIKGIITALDIKIVNETADSLSLQVPPYRVDVTRDVDVIEEILRIYGYNNIEIPTQIRASLKTSVNPPGKRYRSKSVVRLVERERF